jgi:hypothetical protein
MIRPVQVAPKRFSEDLLTIVAKAPKKFLKGVDTLKLVT